MKRPLFVRRLLGRVVMALSLAAVCASTPASGPDSVTIVGTFQSELGCAGDWDAACAQTHLERNPIDGVWRSYFVMPAGNHAFKAALNDSWAENYGANATRDGGDIVFTASEGLVVKFFYDPRTHWVTSSSNTGIAVAAGTFQKALGCTDDWQPGCMLSWLTDEHGQAIHRFTTSAIPAGPHRVKVAHNETWDVNYGAGGVAGGEDILFTVPAAGQETRFVYEPYSHLLRVNVAAPTRTTLTLERSTAMVGEMVAFMAHVEVTEGTAVAAGTVTFSNSEWAFGAVPLDASGTATFLSYASVAGTFVFSATYDGMYLPSSSEGQTLLVAPHATATLHVSASTAIPGQPVTLTAKVVATDPNEPRPTGSIIFKTGDQVLGSVALDAEGQAVFSQAFASGTYSLTAEYSGDSRFLSLTSSAQSLQVSRAASEVELTSSTSPSVYGERVTFTAQVRSGAGAPTGRVLFAEGAVELGEADVDASGVASLNLSTLAVGTHGLTASYSGDERIEGSTSAVLSQQVARAASRTTLTASKGSAVYGETVTFTATVEAVAPGAGLPTGELTFRDGDTVLGTASLASGSATFTTSRLSLATHSVSAEYAGDEGFEGSAAEALTVTVGRGATSTSLQSSPNPSVVGQGVTLVARVAIVAPASGALQGSVTFKDGDTVLGTVALSATGEASWSTSALGEGTHALSAEYSGDAHFISSLAGVSQQVARGTTTTRLSAVPNPSMVEQTVTLTAEVSGVAPATGTPGGQVTFKNGNTVLGSSALDASGRATFATAALASGSHGLSAEYAGDARFEGSSSAVLTQVVARASSSLALTSSANPSVFGQAVSITAQVSPGSGLNRVPGGSITFHLGSEVLGTVSLGASGRATLSLSDLEVGTHTLSASYSGDARFEGSSASALSQVVNRGGTAVSLASSLSPSISGQSVTLTARVSVVAPAVGQPSGEVVFKDGGTVLGSGSLDANGEVRFSTSALAVGTHALTAEYAGDVRFLGSVSQSVLQTVDAPQQPDAGTPTDGGTTVEPDAGTSEPDGGTTTEPDGGTTTAPDAGGQPGSDAGTGPGTGPQEGNGGCGCGATDGASAGSLLLTVWMGLAILRRRSARHG